RERVVRIRTPAGRASPAPGHTPRPAGAEQVVEHGVPGELAGTGGAGMTGGVGEEQHDAPYLGRFGPRRENGIGGPRLIPVSVMAPFPRPRPAGGSPEEGSPPPSSTAGVFLLGRAIARGVRFGF